MNPAIVNNGFVQIAQPIVITLIVAAWLNLKSADTMNKRLDDMNKRLDDMNRDFNRRFDEVFKRLDRIDATLENHGQRIVRLEERTALTQIGT